MASEVTSLSNAADYSSRISSGTRLEAGLTSNEFGSEMGMFNNSKFY